MSKILIDTNILIYAKDSSSLYHQAALKIFSGNDELFITSKNLTEYYSVVTKGIEPLLKPKEALLDLEEFTSNCTLLFPNEASHHQLSALILRLEPKGLLIHDYVIASIGLAHGINKIATLNKSDFRLIQELEVIELT